MANGSRRALLISVIAVSATVFGGAAFAHRTGNERRNVAECQTLRDPARRAACVQCVSRRRPHHYHPLQTEGWRCDPNDGTR